MNNTLEFKVLRDVYSTPNAEGEQDLLKENVRVNVVFNRDRLDGPVEIVSEKTGKVYKSRCILVHSDLGSLTVADSFSNVKDKLYGKYRAVGFK